MLWCYVRPDRNDIMCTSTRDAKSLFPTTTLENSGLRIPTVTLTNLDSDSKPRIQLRLQDVMCDILIVYLMMTWEKIYVLLITGAQECTSKILSKSEQRGTSTPHFYLWLWSTYRGLVTESVWQLQAETDLWQWRMTTLSQYCHLEPFCITPSTNSH